MTVGPHIPVLLPEVVGALLPHDGGIYVDGTFGAGGYSRAILAAAECTLYAIDRDPAARAAAEAVAAAFPGRFHFLAGRFGDMEKLLPAEVHGRIDGIALDIGVSSMQIDRAERGFSFRADGPLDMRMGGDGPTAADLVNALPEAELADLVYRFGEERASRRIAAAIVAARKDKPFATTRELAACVRAVVRPSKDGIDPATRTFQALRIAVNDELGELERALAAAERLLAKDGVLAVVSFHSLEDRIVKRFLDAKSGRAAAPSRHMPHAAPTAPPAFALERRKALSASDSETRLNPRARSAHLRVAVRTAAGGAR
ncbi:16S rRNA (cytosine(1402)-N(4))-methyltransferase RsmH [Oleispirillum naphthae]|uniref:16S rRNA (cytosine(1402)-N(4))-methyltransferase RsmH n=1 Tax=Oleispirillum naphthae TaxID=2838853 RepID=UPI003B67641A